MASTAVYEAVLPSLPSDVVQKIVVHLSMVDICNAAQSGRYLAELTSQLSSLHLKLYRTAPEYWSIKLESLHKFIIKRIEKGMKVEWLSFDHPVPPFGMSDALSEHYQRKVVIIVARCSATLKHLHMSYLWTPKFEPQNYDPVDALYLCRQLRSLSIKHVQDFKGQPHGWNLMQALLASLPELRALQLKERSNGGGCQEPIFVFGSDIVAKVCAANSRGLQLLEMDQCLISKNFVLPSSLRYLFLSDRHSRFKGACQHLLGNLPALEEVHLLNFRSKRLQITESTGMLGHTERLRALVLHTRESVVNYSIMPTTVEMPELELLAVTCTNQDSDNCHILVNLRCPKLKEFIFQDYLLYHKEENLLPLKQLFQASPKLEVLQVAVIVDRGERPDPDLIKRIWRALDAAKSLRSLNFIFQDLEEQLVVQQVTGALEAAMAVESMFLPRLQQLGIFSVSNDVVAYPDSVGPSFQMGSPLANEQGVHGVCNSVGKLVEKALLPALQTIHLYPVVSEEGAPLYGPGPQPDLAPQVYTAFLQQPDGWDHCVNWLRPSCCDAGLQSSSSLPAIDISRAWLSWSRDQSQSWLLFALKSWGNGSPGDGWGKWQREFFSYTIF